MLSLAKKFIAATISFCLLAGVGCSYFSRQNGEAQNSETVETTQNEMPRFTSSDLNTLPSPDAQTQAFLNTEPAQDEASLLVGVWRMSYQGVCPTQAEMIFQPNGGYSGFSQCTNGSYAFHTVGYWRVLQSGAVRVQYTNYEPKQFMGNPIRIPDGETMYYRFLDRNRLGFSGNIIAYRVQ